MEKKLEKLFKNIESLSPEESLRDRILSRIEEERIRLSKRRLFWARTGLLGSVMGIILAAYAVSESFLGSDFWTILTLAFSDMQIVLSHFGDFASSLAETLPVLDIVLFTIPVFTLFVSLSAYFRSKEQTLHSHGHRVLSARA